MSEQVHKKVIYTALTGSYDALKQPAVIREDWDYICFTEVDGQEGVWQLRCIDFEGSNVEKARQVKLQPQCVLPEYEVSVWVDANICITGDEFYDKIESALSEGILFGALPHGKRDCVFDELCVCYALGRISWKQAYTHLRRLMAMRMPRHAGLYETNVLLRRHLHPDVVGLDNAWWDLFRRCSTRDQLTFTPVLACPAACGNTALPLSPVLLFGEGRNARNVDYLQYERKHTGGKADPAMGPVRWFCEKLLRLIIKCYRP